MDITKSSLINCSSSVDDTAIMNKKNSHFNIFDETNAHVAHEELKLCNATTRIYMLMNGSIGVGPRVSSVKQYICELISVENRKIDENKTEKKTPKLDDGEHRILRSNHAQMIDEDALCYMGPRRA